MWTMFVLDLYTGWRHEHMSIPSDIPPINPPEHQMEVCAPKWKEVEQL